MCGIAGWVDLNHGTKQDILIRETESMTQSLFHRGPDASGVWTEERMGIALGHRRLSILDITPTGAQPMESANCRYVISFNGEIYNFASLKRKLSLEGYQFRGSSDTEVLVNAIEAWGIEKTLPLLEGMFAFAVMDRKLEVLHLARDRFGEKPLVYALDENYFWFASEVRAMRKNSIWNQRYGQIDSSTLPYFLDFGCIPGTKTIYQGVSKLEPGCHLELPLKPHAKAQITPYYSILTSIETGEIMRSDLDATNELENLLSDVIKNQTVTDVPYGAFLSGGIDSSTIVALMQKASSRRVKTFCIGFEDAEYNEASFARSVALHLGTDHTEMIITEKDAMNVVPELSQIYDEPFADSSQIPTYLVSKLARQHVTVTLSGDAGDELFAGYNRYLYGPKLWKKIRPIPYFLRKSISRKINSCSDEVLEKNLRVLFKIFPKLTRIPQLQAKIRKGFVGLGAEDEIDLYYLLQSQLPESPASYSRTPLTRFKDSVSMQQYFDFSGYLPDDILTKVDRASMAASLESRIPFLSHRLVDFAWTLPLSQKIRNGQSKWLLKQVLYRHVPSELFVRPKSGFAIPIGKWLKKDLKEWGDDLISKSKIPWARKKWNEHQQNRRDNSPALWNLLMYQDWTEKNGKFR